MIQALLIEVFPGSVGHLHGFKCIAEDNYLLGLDQFVMNIRVGVSIFDVVNVRIALLQLVHFCAPSDYDFFELNWLLLACDYDFPLVNVDMADVAFDYINIGSIQEVVFYKEALVFCQGTKFSSHDVEVFKLSVLP